MRIESGLIFKIKCLYSPLFFVTEIFDGWLVGLFVCFFMSISLHTLNSLLLYFPLLFETF